jgi:hypothetical protein
MKTSICLAIFICMGASPTFAQVNNINPSSLRAANGANASAIIYPDQPFSLNADFSPTRTASLSFVPPDTGWIIDTGYVFSIDTPNNFAVSCRIFSAGSDREVLGQTDTVFTLGEARSGNIRIGIKRGAGWNAYPAGSYECRGQVNGAKRTGGNGVDWRAWEQPDSSSRTGWAQFVKEDGESRYWTGGPFVDQVRLRIAGQIGGIRSKPGDPASGGQVQGVNQANSGRPQTNVARAGLIIGSNRAPLIICCSYEGIGTQGNLGRDSDDAWRPPPIPPK